MGQLYLNTILCSLLHYIAFLNLSVAAIVNDRLLPNQLLVIGQTLVSENHVFEMGFFLPGKSSNRYLGIWYKSTPDVVVWVANRDKPITASSHGVAFMITRNGSLVISSGTIIIWSENPSCVASNPVLHLLESGNLVVVNETTNDYLWQSFDYPTDTLLPAMKMVDDVDAGVERYLTSWRNPDDPSPGDFVHRIENNGLAQIVILKGTKRTYRSGQWNGMHFCGQRFPNPIYIPELVFRKGRLISAGDPYRSSFLVRLTLDTSGTLLRVTMHTKKDKWNPAISFPTDTCDKYDSCGPNCICKSDSPIRCQCFRGFEPKIKKDWELLQDWSGGCIRTKPLNCHGGDGFVEVRGVKYPDVSSFWLNTTMSLGDCKAECLKNCNCTAYANPFVTDGGSGCFMWFGNLIDTKQLSDADSKQNVYIRVPVSELDFSAALEEEKENKRPMKLILISIAFGVLVSTIINGGLLIMARQKRQVKRNNDDLELPVIKMATIEQATNNFSEENIIGVGGFGPFWNN